MTDPISTPSFSIESKPAAIPGLEPPGTISAAIAPPATRRVRLDPLLQKILDTTLKPSRRLLYCALCASAITTEEARTAMNGEHEHRFTNPHGFQFLIGCFSAAPGCAISGPANHADTWFPGCYWQIATCAECQQHLGWWFENPAGRGFYGLILPRLKDAR